MSFSSFSATAPFDTSSVPLRADLLAGASLGPPPPNPAQHARSMQAVSISNTLRKSLGAATLIFDGDSGELIHLAPDRAPLDWRDWRPLVQVANRLGRPTFIQEEDPFVVQALPVVAEEGVRVVAVAVFVTRPVQCETDIALAARALRLAPAELFAWAREQEVLQLNTIERQAELLVAKWTKERRIAQLERENERLSENLAASFEEISLIYRLTHNLKVSENSNDLGRQALGWLAGAVPASSLMIHLLTGDGPDTLPTDEPQPREFVFGPTVITGSQLDELIAERRLGVHSVPLVLNPPNTTHAHWRWPAVKEIVVAPISEGDRIFGWLAAVNHVDGLEFTTVEANLLSTLR